MSIDESNLLGHNDDTSTATVMDDEGIHRFYLALERHSLDTVDRESLHTKEEIKDHRQLQSDTYCGSSCESYCLASGRPKILVSGSNFQSLITNCIDGTGCAAAYNVPFNCWETSKVTDMYYAFIYKDTFNKPLYCWDVSNVTRMKGMFAYSIFNQSIESWDVSKVTDMINMFYSANTFNQCLATWDDKTVAVDTSLIFNNGECPFPATNQNVGPWCQASTVCSTPALCSTTSPTASPSGSLKNPPSGIL